jgi:hypothetical protein
MGFDVPIGMRTASWIVVLVSLIANREAASQPASQDVQTSTERAPPSLAALAFVTRSVATPGADIVLDGACTSELAHKLPALAPVDLAVKLQLATGASREHDEWHRRFLARHGIVTTDWQSTGRNRPRSARK